MTSVPPPGDAGLEEILQGFVAECGDLVRAFSDAVIALPDASGPARTELVREAFRAVHSVKGGALSLQLGTVADLANAMEDVLDVVRRSGRELDASERATLLECGDALIVAVHAAAARQEAPPIQALVDRLRGGQGPAVANVAGSAEGDRTLRVPLLRVDALSALAGELVVLRSRAKVREDEARAVADHVEALAREVAGGDVRARQLASTATSAVHALGRSLARDALRAGLLATKVIEGIRGIRLTSVATMAGSLRRVVHDASSRAGKSIDFTVTGEQVELDKETLDALKDPLVHLLRNAVDHGIEDAEARVRAGKPRRGAIELALRQGADRVQLELSDDGRGVDFRALKAAAVRVGAITDDEASALTEGSVLDLMALPSVSTRIGPGELSGRGVGFDVVRRNVEQQLGGRVSCESIPGVGTRFTLSVPVNIATVRALVVRVAGQAFALPLSSVDYATRLRDEDIAPVEGRLTVADVDGGRLELIDLGRELGLPASQTRGFAIVVRAKERRAALAVDVIQGEEEVVQKRFVPPLRQVGPVIGGTVIAGDEPLLLLGAAELLRSPRPTLSVSPKSARSERPRALVVDDSITTRSLEATILKKHGFDVVSATNGREALEELRRSPPDVLITDLEMPEMDGLELCRQVRADARLSQLPVVIVTSVSSAAGRAAGLDAGADAYVEKGKFDQAEFLSLLRGFTSR